MLKLSSSAKLLALLVIASLLLFGLGVAAAWNVHRQQVTTSELVAREFRGIIVEEDLYHTMREIRILILQFLLTKDQRTLDSIPALCQKASTDFTTLRNFSEHAEETGQIERAFRGYAEFLRRYELLNAVHGWEQTSSELQSLVEQVLTPEIIRPLRKAVELNEQIVERTNQANRKTTEELRQGFLLLGLTGGAGGIIMGLVLAHSHRQSILQMNVSISGAAGSLERVVGPLQISRSGGMDDLGFNMREMETRITEVVERLQSREKEVLHNEQLAAIGQLAAGMAHELRNPLMPMKILVQSAIERGASGGLQGRQLQVLSEEISRLEQSIQVFLDFARPPNLEFVPLDLREIIHQTVQLTSAKARQQQVDLLVDVPDSPCSFPGDPVQLRQVVLNLILNALDEFSQPGTITVRLTPDSRSTVWRLLVKDDGPGIPESLLDRIFDPFVSDKETGTGLGLAISRRIIEMHSGTIRARNDAKGGAEFLIELPIVNSTTENSLTTLAAQN